MLKNKALPCYTIPTKATNMLLFFLHIRTLSVSCQNRASVLYRAVCVRSPYSLKSRGGSQIGMMSQMVEGLCSCHGQF